MKIFDVIFSNDNIEIESKEELYIEKYGSLFFTLISVILTLFNIYMKRTFMTVATVILIVGFLLAYCLALKNLKRVSRIIMALLCALIFSLFAITGGNNGFAILWILLVPVIGMFLIGLKDGFILSLYFQVFLIVLFYTPLKNMVSAYYTRTFMARFPVLYFASFGAVTLLMCQKQRLSNEFYYESHYDSLSDLYNRRYFNETVKKMEKEGMDENLVVYSLDVNRLKYYNDNVGHDAGDILIKGASDIIKKVFDEDLYFRIGGDEFAVLSTRKNVIEIIQKLKDECTAYRNDVIKEMSISVGYVRRSDYPELSFEDLSRIADKKMYVDKSNYYKSHGFDRRSSDR